MAKSINGNKDEIRLVEKSILIYPISKIAPRAALTWFVGGFGTIFFRGNFNKRLIMVNQPLNSKTEIRSKAINGRTYVTRWSSPNGEPRLKWINSLPLEMHNFHINVNFLGSLIINNYSKQYQENEDFKPNSSYEFPRAFRNFCFNVFNLCDRCLGHH